MTFQEWWEENKNRPGFNKFTKIILKEAYDVGLEQGMKTILDTEEINEQQT